MAKKQKIWEYALISGQENNIEVYHLNELGAQGWELVSGVWNNDSSLIRAIMKRKIAAPIDVEFTEPFTLSDEKRNIRKTVTFDALVAWNEDEQLYGVAAVHLLPFKDKEVTVTIEEK